MRSIEAGEREKERMAAAAAAHQDAAPEAAKNEDQAVIPSMEELVKSSRKLDPTSGTQAYQAFDPALPKEMFDSAIFPAIEQAWKDSNPQGNWRQKKEQGGWVVREKSGNPKFVRVPEGLGHSIDLGNEPEDAIFSFHTHPNKAPLDALVDGPGAGDVEAFKVNRYTVLGIVRSHLGYHIIHP